MGIILRASRHPKDDFCAQVLVGRTYGLGARYKPWKKILVITAVDYNAYVPVNSMISFRSVASM